MKMLRSLPFLRTHVDDEKVKIKRLEEAESEVKDLQVRANRAIAALDKRRQENHWRESIERMIHGC